MEGSKKGTESQGKEIRDRTNKNKLFMKMHNEKVKHIFKNFKGKNILSLVTKYYIHSRKISKPIYF